jgi:hypothetical protein
VLAGELRQLVEAMPVVATKALPYRRLAERHRL